MSSSREPSEAGEAPQSFFVRALYDFTSDDASSLSFEKGAIIEVLTQLESGWWDGLLGNDVRGWFPSNYVEPITDEEAEEELRARGIVFDDGMYSDDDSGASQEGGGKRRSEAYADAYSSLGIAGQDFETLRRLMGNDPAMDHADAFEQLAEAAMLSSRDDSPTPAKNGRGAASTGMTPTRSSGFNTTTTTTTSERTRAYSASNTPSASTSMSQGKTLAGRPRAATAEVRGARDKSSDFWVPKVNERGEIMYHNTRTGQESFDLPDGAELGSELSGAETSQPDEDEVPLPPGQPPVRPGFSRQTSAMSVEGQSGRFWPGNAAARRNPVTAMPDPRSVARPWKLRVTDDERAYFFFNTETKESCWEAPPGALRRGNVEGLGDTFEDASGEGSRRPSLLSLDTDDSDTDPDAAPGKAARTSTKANDMPPLMRQAEEQALKLQHRLEGGAVAPLGGFLARTSEAISHLAAVAAEPLPENGAGDAKASPSERLGEATFAVVDAVRDLLYVAGSLAPQHVDVLSTAEASQRASDRQGPTDPLGVFRSSAVALHGRYDAAMREQPLLATASQQATQNAPSSLAPLSKKVNATLSKLVLSARAVIEQPGISANGIADLSPAQLEKLNSYRQRVQDDAIDLARAVGAFNVEAERVRATQGPNLAAPWIRRLGGVLRSGGGSAGVGMELLGGGSAAGWRGQGFVLPTATQAAALRAEAQGSFQNPFELTRETQGALSSGKLALRRKPMVALSRERIEGVWAAHLAELLRDLSRLRSILTGTTSEGEGDLSTGSVKLEGTPAKAVPRSGSRQLLGVVQSVLARFGTAMVLLEATDLASSLDFDGPANARAANDLEFEAYVATVGLAREQAQALALAKQGAYDASASLMMDLQDVSMEMSMGGRVEADNASQVLASANRISSSLRELNESVVRLVDIAEDQRHQQQAGIVGALGARAKVYGAEHVRLNFQRPAAPARTSSTRKMSGAAAAALPVASTGGSRRTSQASTTTDTIGDEVMYLGPGLAVPNGPPASKSASSATAGASLASPVSGSIRSSAATSLSTAASRARSTSVTTGASGASHDSNGRQRRGTDADSGPPPKAVEEVPWFLEPDYGPDEIVFNANGGVKGATLGALMERLTMHNAFDASFNNTFLMTYRSFTTTDEFLQLLFARFRIRCPPGLEPDEVQLWMEKKQMPIRLRVFNILKSWLESHFYEGEDEVHLKRVKDFALDEMAHSQAMETPSKLLIRLVERREGAGEQMVRKMVMPTSAPPPILPKSRKIKFLDIDPLEMARQLTLIDSRLYNRVRPVECLAKAWSRPDGAQVAKGIREVINANNRVSGWVSEAILVQEDLKKRAAWVKQFVAIADRCYALNNFSSMMAIYSGLNNASLNRLKRTWDTVNQRHLQLFENMKQLLAPTKNFSKYRETLRNLNPPCVPFLGVYLTDLTFIEDGNSDRLKTDERLINFSKRQMTAEKISEIVMLQSTPYNLVPVPGIQKFIEDNINENRSLTEDELFEQSLRLEPREREDEKIARLLLESGFI